MAYKVYDSFDFAEFVVDYNTKRIGVSYPYKTSKFGDYVFYLVMSTLLLIYFFGFLCLIDIILAINTFYLLIAFMACFVGIQILWITNRHLARRIIFYYIDFNYVFFKSKRYVELYAPFKTNIVCFKNVGNWLTEYKLTGDCNRLLLRVEMRCIEHDESKDYVWELYFLFSERPKTGRLFIMNKKDPFSFQSKNLIEIEFITSRQYKAKNFKPIQT